MRLFMMILGWVIPWMILCNAAGLFTDTTVWKQIVVILPALPAGMAFAAIEEKLHS